MYRDTETDELVHAEEYFGLTGTILLNGVTMYVQRGDWVITRADGTLTAYQAAAFAQRFVAA